MKISFLTVVAMFVCSHALAAPKKRIVESCLATESLAPSISYAPLSPTNYYTEEDEDSSITSHFFKYQERQVGTWEHRETKQVGLLYGEKKIARADFIRLGRDEPANFDLPMAQWAVLRKATHQYLCAAFNFEGLGQSGSYQNIRGAYLIDMQSRRTKVYYVVGDIRSISR